MISRNTLIAGGLFAGLLTCDVAAQVLEKYAALHASGAGLALTRSFASQPWVWIVLAIKLAQLLLWLAILKRVNLSVAFPLTALAYPLTVGASIVLFHETVSPTIWLGCTIITAGVALMSGGPEDGPVDAGRQPGDSPPTGRRRSLKVAEDR